MKNVVYEWDIGDKRGIRHFILMRNASLIQLPFREMTGVCKILEALRHHLALLSK
jgi:hypothetical protein